MTGLTKQETVQQWADRVILIWEEKIMSLGATFSFQLVNSFVHHILQAANGDIAKIEFSFEYYGRFVDMGVGRGVAIADVQYSKRRSKPWYNKTFLLEVKKLSNILAAKYARQAAIIIVENIDDNALKYSKQWTKI